MSGRGMVIRALLMIMACSFIFAHPIVDNDVNTTLPSIPPPPERIPCTRFAITTTFHSYKSPYDLKTPYRVYVDRLTAHLHATVREASATWETPILNGYFAFKKYGKGFEIEDTGPPAYLTYRDVLATVGCMDVFVGMWPNRPGVPGSQFELVKEGQGAVYARGQFGVVDEPEGEGEVVGGDEDVAVA